MKELQFENFELSGRQSEQNQGASPSSKLLNSSTAISFSAKVVSLLKEKAKWHNKKNPSNKTNISEVLGNLSAGCPRLPKYWFYVFYFCLIGFPKENQYFRTNMLQ